jgi:hypothetical protein
VRGLAETAATATKNGAAALDARDHARALFRLAHRAGCADLADFYFELYAALDGLARRAGAIALPDAQSAGALARGARTLLRGVLAPLQLTRAPPGGQAGLQLDALRRGSSLAFGPYCLTTERPPTRPLLAPDGLLVGVLLFGLALLALGIYRVSGDEAVIQASLLDRLAGAAGSPGAGPAAPGGGAS